MKKFICSFLLVLCLAGCAFAIEKHILRLGLLSKLNTTEKEFADAWQKTYAPKNGILEVDTTFFPSMSSLLLALNSGQVQHAVLPYAVADYVMRQNNDTEAALVLPARGMGLAFGFLAENKSLRDKFSEAVIALKNNLRLAALEGVYLSNSGMDFPEPVNFEKFDGAEKIKVAVTGDMPPIDFIAPDGTPAGFNTAVLAEIGNFLGVNIELIEVDADARTSALVSGRADVVFWYEVDTTSQIQTDIPEGVIVSAPYYEWDKFIHVRRKMQNSRGNSQTWNVKSSILDLFLLGR